MTANETADALDIIDTPIGPLAVEFAAGRITRTSFAESPRFGRGGRLSGGIHVSPKVRQWLRDWFAGRPVRPLLDLSDATPFERRVYDVVRRIPRGRTLTYGEVARKAGRPGAARAVGQAMAKNPICVFIPCHRVVSSTGLGGFSARNGAALKRRLLAIEGVSIP